MDEENNNALSEEELDEVIKQNPQIGITEDKKKELTEQVTGPILKEAEERMTQAVRSRKPVEGLTRQEQIEAAPEGQIPARPSGVPSPKADQIALPTTLPKHGIRALFSEGERILERASQVTNLPPESPATQAIAQRMAKGDPFSSEALDDAKAETMRLVRAGLIPNPYYEGFTGSVLQAYETVAPLVVETGAPMIVGAAFSPMLFSPVPGSRVGYFKLLGATSFTSNLIAQQMRIGYGQQDKTSWSEAAAATLWGMAPGVKTPKDMTKIGKVLVRGVEGAFMAGGENATRQGLELLYGKDGEFSVGELGLTTATGGLLGAAVGRLESALVKYDPKEPSAAILKKAVKDELKAAKKEVARLKKAGQVRGLRAPEAKIAKLEKDLEALELPENKVLQRAIDQLEEYEQKQVEAFELYAKEFEQSKAAQALKESDVPTSKEKEGVSKTFLEYDESTNPEYIGSMQNPHYKAVMVGEEGFEYGAYMNEAGEIIDLRAETPIKIDKTLEKLDDDELEEALRVKNNELEDLENWEDDSKIPKGDLEKIIELRSEVEAFELEDWRRNVEWRAEDLIKDPEAINDPFNDLFGKVWDQVKIDNDMANVKVAMAFEAIKKRGLENQFKDFLKAQQRSLGTQVEAEDAEFLFRTQMEKATNAYKKFLSKPAIEEPTAKVEEADLESKLESWILERQQFHKDEYLKQGGKKTPGWEDQALQKVSVELQEGKLPEGLSQEDIEMILPLTKDRETGDVIGPGAPSKAGAKYPRTGTLLDFLEGRQTKKIEEVIDDEVDAFEWARKQEAREILDDFMAGGGTRDFDLETGKIKDTEDEIKARLLTDDAEKKRLINVVQDAIKEDLQNVKGGREGKLEYLSKVQKELDRRLGNDAGDEYALVLKASQLSDNLEVADALNELSVQMTANGAVMVKGFDDLLKYTREKDFNNVEDLNDAMVSIHRLIPQMLGWKKTGSAAGRLLQSRKYTKDSLEVKVDKLEQQLEENLVSNLKSSKDLSGEELDKQIKTFGDIEAIKKLLKAVQQADDVSEVKKILIDQQNAFQNGSTLKKYLKSTLKGEAITEAKYREGEEASLYTKVRDVGMDVTYSSMLSAPTTAMKVGIGNAVMSRYHTWMGQIGAKYMALAPWARRGMSKQEFQASYDFWSKTASSYKEFNDIALQEARRVFKSGDSDLASHFERVGESALSMERTGLSGALGQSLENLGQFIDVPGKALTAIDSRTRMRVAHAMTKAKAEHDWHLAKLNGEEVPDNFDEYYQGFLAKVFNDKRNKLMTEDQVRRQAILNAEKEGVDENNLASYIDNYVKNNWDTSTSNFVNYVQRNLKEITFTDELGEFAKINTIEKGLALPAENFLSSFPLLKTILSPFQRTGRNIIREAASTTSFLADLPVVSKYADNLWSKTVQDLNSGDPIVAARAKGRQIVGAGIIASAWGMAEAGLYVGTIAQNWKKKENIENGEGLGDYELRIPGPDGLMVGVDISPLEPFATVMNIVADCHTLSKGTMAQKQEAMHALQILALVVSNNIGNKTYFKNLGDALELVTLTSESEEASDAKRLRLVKGLVATTVPAGINAQSMSTDDVRRRGDTMLQIIGKRIGGIAREVPAYRDVFGDPMALHKGDVSKMLSMFNPFKFSVAKMRVDDYVTEDKELGTRRFNKEKFQKITLNKKSKNYNEEEVRNAAHAVIIELDGEYNFNNGTTIKDGVDLQEVIHEETRVDAFSRWQQIYQTIKNPDTGLTIKEAIVTEAKKPEFLNAFSIDPNKKSKEFKEEDERLKRVNEVFSKYRTAAYEQLELEYPILVEQREETKYRNRLKRYGVPDSPEQRKKYKEQVIGRLVSEMPIEEHMKKQPDTRLKELLQKTPYAPVTLD
jgi:hypothetical protein